MSMGVPPQIDGSDLIEKMSMSGFDHDLFDFKKGVNTLTEK